ncbi:WXG100 family type VII secretion target [Streptomyces sp. NPDC049954]|uniref:WXG100 family type VII secretion target n=1 Tax=Streptomyces sp. NPDC049954 TaxID=3155779 RepID=UPI00341948DE
MSDDFSDGFIYVNYAHADNAAEDMRLQTQAIARTLSNLEMELQELKQSWEGDDREAYDGKQRAWDHAVQKMGDLLTSHAGLLNEIKNAYQNNERNLTQGWDGVRIGR